MRSWILTLALVAIPVAQPAGTDALVIPRPASVVRPDGAFVLRGPVRAATPGARADLREIADDLQDSPRQPMRHVTVVPEIEMPGHASSAPVACPQFSCAGETAGVPTTWGVFEDVFCPGKREAFRFLQDVLDEGMAIFPSKIIHLGVDEVPKDHWKACARCQQRIRDEGLQDERELQGCFVKRIEAYVRSKGREVAGWDEILADEIPVRGVAEATAPEGGARPAPEQTADRPNVLLVVIDDMGWKDTAVYGSAFYETPNIDRLAAGGARFSQFYTAGSVCSPTRASLMTGRSPARVHITDWIGGDDSGRLLPATYEHQLALEELTIGEAFQAAGYDTGYIGKWHLGEDRFMPAGQGFAFTRAVNRAGQPGSHFAPYRSASTPNTDVPELEDATPGEYLTDRLTTEAVRFMRTPRTRPFFLVLSHYAVHTPLEAKTDLVDKYAAKRARQPATTVPAAGAEGATSMTKMRQDHPTYAAMVESVDASVGQLMQALDSLGIAKNTIVVFMSDNGGLSTLLRTAERMPTSNAPLRAGKGWLYEGGIRAPLIVRWPGVVANGMVVETPTISSDLYPTLLQLAGLPLRPTQHLDGMSVAPVLRGRGKLSRDTLYWHFPHYHGSGSTPSGAIRKGSLKLIEWFEDGRAELYDLARDPGELRDLAAERPREVADLRADLARWRTAVGARMPQPRSD